LLLAPPAAPAQGSGELRVVVPQDLFARVNGISLHYLDWGGTGDLLLMLPGWSHTAHTFAGIAPAFTDRFHVVGLTRRGHGASDKPRTGFAIDDLVNDVVAFVEALGAKRVVLVGHSFGGREIPLVAARLAGRVRALVFLDAVYDWPMMGTIPGTADINRFMTPPDSAFVSRAALEAWFRTRDPGTWGRVAEATLRAQTHLTADGRVAFQLPLDLGRELAWMTTTGTDYSAVTAPSLAVYTDQADYIAEGMKAAGYPAADQATARKWGREGDLAVKRSGIASLRRARAPVTVVGMAGPHLIHWYDPAAIVQMMNRFLDALPR
jgi:pimeloyl-ACP methyl ester carboxylesterase